MKKLALVLIFGLSVSSQVFAATDNEMKPTTKLLAANCPKGCSSCWDQCTKASDCGSGHKCIGGACGNRCVSET